MSLPLYWPDEQPEIGSSACPPTGQAGQRWEELHYQFDAYDAEKE